MATPSTIPPAPPPSTETQFISSIDVGTSSIRFIIFDQFANLISSFQKEFDQIHAHPGWHEHDPQTYLDTIDECVVGALEHFEGVLGFERKMIMGVGVATQRETTVLWRRDTGKKICNAVAWPDTRNTATVRSLRDRAASQTFYRPPAHLRPASAPITPPHRRGRGRPEVVIESDSEDDENAEAEGEEGDMKGEEGVRRLTGLPFSTYFSATKYAWLLEHNADVRAAKEDGNLMMGTVDSWLLYNFTKTETSPGLHVTDYTNASRTLLLSLESLDWDQGMLDFFDLPRWALPRLVSNSEVYGRFGESHPLSGIPIAGLVGDQQGALLGNLCLEKGAAKQTYGTGCFMLYNTGQDIVASTHGLLTTVGYMAGPNAQVHYALEGSVAVGGSSIQWLRDNLGIIEHPRQAGELAEQVEDTGGVYFVTGFSGLFAPYWDMAATGMLIGLSTYSTKHHIARATLEATCFQTRAILEAMAKDTETQQAALARALRAAAGQEWNSDESDDDDAIAKEETVGLKVLKVDGGMTASDVTMQLQADILGIEVERPLMRESTALGAALLAGAALKLFGWDLDRPASLGRVNKAGVTLFKPHLPVEEREWKYAGWNRAVNRSRGWKTNSGNG